MHSKLVRDNIKDYRRGKSDESQHTYCNQNYIYHC